ncbi:MAG: SpoIID/LytB domain-containing protein [Candidatus Eisenbacteria bacterium]|nr:SpoIID/LytB domain-containing protein [Candidatus Latescibacterota bacterium]MBD3302748.1 SpoIID/LytB domain-containing protein [Candidatus Eisenbacteria bacterium]
MGSGRTDPRGGWAGRGSALLIAFLLVGCASRPAPPPADPDASPAREDPRSQGPIPLVRVGIAPDVSLAVLSADGAWAVGIMGRAGSAEAIPAGASLRFHARGGSLHLDGLGTTRAIGSDTLYAYPKDRGSTRLSVGSTRYRGEMLVFASGEDRLTVVNVVDLESYLRGVVPAEIGRSGPERIEAVKAQAVAARTYTLANMSRWRSRGFDLLATVADQVYLGADGERADVDEAVRATTGVVALHEGRPILAYYSSTCGGITAGPETVWGKQARPYLKARRCRARRGADSFCAPSPYYRWIEVWDGPVLETILKRTLPGATGEGDPESWGRLVDLEIEKRSNDKRVEELEIRFEKRRITIGGDAIRWVLRRPDGGSLRSALLLEIQVEEKEGRANRVAVRGAGFGHGVGLCQYGAIGMARAGVDYLQILRFYYRGVRLVRAYRAWPA